MCVQWVFVKLQEKATTANTNIDNRSLSEILKESFAHKGFRLLILGFFVCDSNYFNSNSCSKVVPDKGLADWTGMAILALIGFLI